MKLFAESDLLELEGQFPDDDVRRCAEAVERHAKTAGVTFPMGLIRAWLTTGRYRLGTSPEPRREPAPQRPIDWGERSAPDVAAFWFQRIFEAIDGVSDPTNSTPGGVL